MDLISSLKSPRDSPLRKYGFTELNLQVRICLLCVAPYIRAVDTDCAT